MVKEGAAVKAPARRGRKPAPKSLEQAIAGEDLLEILVALRAATVAEVKTEKGQSKATMYRQIQQLSLDIEALRQERQRAAREEGSSGGSGSAEGTAAYDASEALGLH